MIRSIWRYSHFLLAVSSSIFLLLASVTGIILAVEPISNATKEYSINDLDEIPLSETISGLKSKYSEVLELEVTPANHVIVSVLTEDFESKDVYINPKDLSEIGAEEERSEFFNFVTNFHRSLFLKSPGRIFVGLLSLFLSLIAITGILLLIKRQGGILRFFDRIKEKNFEQRYHIILGRWLLIPIIIIALTGVYLSAEKFELLPTHSLKHSWGNEKIENYEQIPITEFSFLQGLNLDEVRMITFPFSQAPEDFYQLQLDHSEIMLHQFSGEIVSEQKYPMVQLASMLSMQLHTGESSPVWSLVLLVSSASILFFIYSGFAMSLKTRRKKKKKKQFGTTDKDEAEFIVLVGSETGNTYAFANRFCESLQSQNRSVHLAKMNDYSTYEKALKMVIFTATYGDGDAPSSASNFLKKFNQVEPLNSMEYSVVGFGSMLYPNFCSYAEEVAESLKKHPDFKNIMELTRINEQSFEQFRGWANNWGAKEDIPVHLELSETAIKKADLVDFRVTSITKPNNDDTFLLELKPGKKLKFQSGDLIGITPPKARRERLYSIARTGKSILLSVKKHELGKCSSFLAKLHQGDAIRGRIEKNAKFHFPKGASPVIMISNGTGIAPYLGMISKAQKPETYVFWGGRNSESFELYRNQIEKAIENKHLQSYEVAFSREGEKTYVQDLLKQKWEFLITSLENGAVLMICGSVIMQNGVLKVIEDILDQHSEMQLADLELNNQIRMDCY